jgi:hypothetical protein
MPLRQVQAAITRAIHEDLDEGTARRLFETFPELSQAERQDLLAIPFDRLEPYQFDVYSYETGLMDWGFEHTWLALSRLGFGQEPGAAGKAERDFMVDFKTRYPSQTHAVRELASNFVRYLIRDRKDLSAARPWLTELAEMERLEIETLYTLDNPRGRPLPAAGLPALFDRSIDELFGLRVVRAEGVVAHQFESDPSAIKQALSTAEQTGEQIDLAGKTFGRLETPERLIIARDHESLQPSWYLSDGIEFNLLEPLRENEPTTIEALAETYAHLRETELAHGEPPPDNKTLLRDFLALLTGWFERRYLLLVD